MSAGYRNCKLTNEDDYAMKYVAITTSVLYGHLINSVVLEPWMPILSYHATQGKCSCFEFIVYKTSEYTIETLSNIRYYERKNNNDEMHLAGPFIISTS